jgi:hypothetical protein
MSFLTTRPLDDNHGAQIWCAPNPSHAGFSTGLVLNLPGTLPRNIRGPSIPVVCRGLYVRMPNRHTV